MDGYFDLGEYSRKISTDSKDAQLWFDRGLNWCYCFNHEEGVACFHKALEHDPDCAMAHWGIAFGSGPFYNLPWRDFGKVELAKYAKICHDHARMAESLISSVSAVEADIITALTFRFGFDGVVPVDELDKSDSDYANAMREVYKKHPQDLDVMALFTESMMTRTPWKLWDIKTGKPAENSDIVEVMGVLDKAIAICDERAVTRHPAITHLHIHAVEMSPSPEDAMGSADILCALCPDGGHLNHMPSHIYVLCGMYEEAKIANERAIRADRLYLDYAGPYNFYTTARCHNLCMMMHTCMFLGQFEPAFAAAKETCETLSRDVLEVQDRPQLATIMEAYYSMAVHVLVRFGKWQEIIESPMPECPILYVVSTPMHHYAKGISYATLGRFDDADRERERFYESVQRVPKGRKFFKNFGTDVLAVAEKMLEGEVEYHKGNHASGYEHLRESVRRNDNLTYSEPWVWMHPPRHALGALLMEQGQFEDAEAVYRTDLGLNDVVPRGLQNRNNVWSLHGLSECLARRGDEEESIEINKKLALAVSKADITIASSCCCRKPTVDAALRLT